jgi:putative flippase GtrA
MQNSSNQPQTQLPTWIVEHFPGITKLWLRTPNWFHQAVRFGMVGVLNTGVDLGSYWILTRLIPLFFNNHVLAKAISYTLGVINSYLWNRSFTFRSQVRSPKRFVLFFVINLLAVGINSGMMALALNVYHAPEWVGLVMATLITMTFNFITSKFVVFRSPAISK